jgi:hypothetical protein
MIARRQRATDLPPGAFSPVGRRDLTDIKHEFDDGMSDTAASRKRAVSDARRSSPATATVTGQDVDTGAAAACAREFVVCDGLGEGRSLYVARMVARDLAGGS